MRRILFCVLAACLIMASSCQKEDGPAPETRTVVTLKSGNKTMPVSGNVSIAYNDSPASNTLDKLVDNNLISSFKTPRSAVDIVFQADQPFALQTYKLVSAVGNVKNDPAKWEVSASKDGASWTLIDSQDGQNFPGRNLELAYDVRCQTEFSYYKI